MDPFSHAILGGTAACASTKSASFLRAAAFSGAVAGMMPDLDVLIRQADNPMLGLGFHRHFTHSLLFVPIGSAAAVLFVRLFFKGVPFCHLYLACFAGMLMHGILDSMTNYGTHLFWPFTDQRESWSIISIVDPVFTLTLLLLLVLAVWRKAHAYAFAGIFFAIFYLGFGYFQREEATSAMMAQASARMHSVTRYEVKPSIGNLFAWRGQYEHEGRAYIDAYHVSPWRGLVVYEGGSLPLYRHDRDVGPVQQKDLEYFSFFSDGWLAYAPENTELLGDIRFSMLPNNLQPIWGIRFQEDLQKHVLFESVRSRKDGDFQKLWGMIKGVPPEKL